LGSPRSRPLRWGRYPRECNAQPIGVFATKIFSNDAGKEHGLAYDAAANWLYTVERATTLVDPQLRAYSLDGTRTSDPHALSATTGSLTKMGLHVVRAGVTIGAQAVAAGTLTYLCDGVLYALDETDGSVLASEVVDPNFDTGGLCTAPLAGGGKGLGYSTLLGHFMATSSCCNCSGVAEFSEGRAIGFIPVSIPGSSGAGDVKEQPALGNPWVGNAPAINSLSVFSPKKTLLQQFDVFDADTLLAVGIMRLAFDATGETLWLIGSNNGDIYQLDVSKLPEPVPALHSWGALLLALAFAGSAAGFARRT
jgi:hypothetical protein